ncbi:hypothetical protein C8J57DRAFT_1378407 [Mycena rebaudengoi]|nr:hypothetical protein C8J57DRAFT_1378407 [Mycena rebaudengoi]
MVRISESCGSSTCPIKAEALAQQTRRADIEDIKARISRNTSQMNLLEKRRRELGVQIEVLQRAVRELDSGYDDLKGQRRDLDDALILATGFPCTVPPEITSLIFLYCVENSNLFLAPTPVLDLSHVCRKWREITFATCRLWTSLRVDFDGACRDISNNDTHTFLHGWVGRAKGQPLSLSFSSSVALPPAIFPLIAAYSRQLRALKVSLVSTDVQICNGILGPFPLLHHLTITSKDLTSGDRVAIFKDTPELLYLAIGAPTFNLSAFSLLNHLELRDISVSQFYEVLISCPQLVYLWTSLDSKGGIPDSPVPIMSPYLETLVLAANTGEYGRIFDSLTLPQLVWLRPVDNVPFKVFQAFIVRSACDLCFLHLDVDDWTPEQFTEFLDTIHFLSRLSLNIPPYSNLLLECLTSATLLPHLEDLFIYCWCPELDYDLIITIFTSRRDAG